VSSGKPDQTKAFFMDKVLILSGKSQKGKNRIREQGPEWLLIKSAETVPFSSNKGPWLL
jgi:hypothetical protein